MLRNRVLSFAGLAVLICAFASSSLSQAPNTAAMVINIVDQNGAVVPGASITVTDTTTGAERELTSNGDGSVTVAALPLTGNYKITVKKQGFNDAEATSLILRSGETASVKVEMMASGGKNEVTVFGTAEGVRADAQIGISFHSKTLNETPLLGRKLTSVPLLNSAFRQGKGTGDLFVNQTYFITGVGSRRATTYTLDGANNDEGWGRQTAIATVPLGAVQEITVLSNAFSTEYGWTSGPALNIVTKSGTNEFHGEGIVMGRPGGSWQAKSFNAIDFCPRSVITCVPRYDLNDINPVDIPDKLLQFSGAIGGPIVNDKTFFFIAADRTHQDRTAILSNTLPAWLLPADGSLEYEGHYRQTLINGRLDHRFTANQNLMLRFNWDQMYDDNPQDAVGGTNAPSVARRYTRKAWTAQLNHTWILGRNWLNEARFAYLHGGPVTRWEAQTNSTIYTRGAGQCITGPSCVTPVSSIPFTTGQSRSSELWGKQWQVSDTLSWTHGRHYLKFGGGITRHRSGGTGNEPGALTLGTFTFFSNTASNTRVLDLNNPSNPNALTINDVQNYQQPINFGIDRYDLPQWLITGFVQDSFHVTPDLTLDLGLRYDRQTLTDATKNFAPRIGFGWHPRGDPRTAIRGGYGMYYTQIRANAVAGYLVNGLDGLTTYTATSGQTGFPTCLTCVPINVDPRTIPANQIAPRDITIRAGLRDFYVAQFQRYGLNFNLLPNYPDKLVNPRSQVFTVGIEHEIWKGVTIGGDYVRQRLTDIDRTVDLNAPTPFNRTAPGQCRVASCNNAANVTAANLTRPIFPANGGVRQVNAYMNLGEADYNGLQTLITVRRFTNFYGSFGYTLSKATNTTEPDGNGIGPNESNLSALGEQERGPSVVDQRHRVVFQATYRFPWNFTAGTVMMFASARPFNATTGVDNNGDGIQNDRPVINGVIVPKSAFRGTPTQDISAFVENRIRTSETTSLTLRFEAFNITNHANLLGRGVTVYGNAASGAVNNDFGAFTNQFTTSGPGRVNGLPAFANIDPPRMFQLMVRFSF
jgi:hypothetical protein